MKKFLFTYFILLNFLSVKGQNTPIYSWQEHLSYQSSNHILEVENNIYCATENGLFYYNKEDFTINRLNKLNGLSDIGISALSYDKSNKIINFSFMSDIFVTIPSFIRSILQLL